MKPQINRTDQKSAVANYIAEMIGASTKKQCDIAREAGFGRSVNTLALIKSGKMKIALDRVGPLCKACGRDSDKLFMLVMNEYHPTILESLGEVRGEVIAEDEVQLLKLYRNAKCEKRIAFREEHKAKGIKVHLYPQSGMIKHAIEQSIEVTAI